MGLASGAERLLLWAAIGHARWTSGRFVRATERAEAVQGRLLAERIRRNADSDWGRRHGFGAIRSYADFVSGVPITTYDDYAPYIERLKRGETFALLGGGQRVLMFALTSGAAREPKFIPVTQEFLNEYRRGWNVWGLRALLDHPGCFLRSIVQVSSPMVDGRTEAGIPYGAITGLMAARQKRLVRKYYSAPAAVSRIVDPIARYYTIMRLSIARDVSFLITANPATLLLLVQTADEQRERIIRDIHDGTLSEALPVSAEVRAALAPRLTPDPAGARRLESLVSEHGALLPRHYWRLGFVAHWTGGTMGLYRSRFPHWFGELPVRDPGLLASEGRISVPLQDYSSAGVLDVTSHFYEFVPAEEYESSARRALTISQLEVGREYFLLLTTSSGFCRYDIGDRVRVVGWYGAAPVIEFLSKGANTSSLAGEKLTEHQVVAAMQDVQLNCGSTLDSFVLAPRWGDVPCYRLFLEEGPAVPGRRRDDFREIAAAMDGALSAVNLEYASKRKTLRLGPIEPVAVPAGTLADLDRRLRQRQSGRAEQYKHRYLISEPSSAEELPAGLS